jgi:hypothetical protein
MEKNILKMAVWLYSSTYQYYVPFVPIKYYEIYGNEYCIISDYVFSIHYIESIFDMISLYYFDGIQM